MRALIKLTAGMALAFLFLAGLPGGAADAHWRGGFRGGIFIAPPYPYYDPWYDPYYYPDYPPPDYGWLKTDVEPNDAEVWVDGRFFGYVKDYDGPIHHLRLPLGVHEVQFKEPDYKTFKISVDIGAGGTTEVEYNLVALPSGPSPGGEKGSESGGSQWRR